MGKLQTQTGGAYKKVLTDIFVEGRFYGSIRIPFCTIIPTTEDEIRSYIENRLPLLKRKKYHIAF